MKLYELHRGEMFTLNLHQGDKDNSATLPKELTDKLFILNTLDGMYSNCSDTENNVYHFAVWTEVTSYSRDKSRRDVSRIDIIGQNGNEGLHYEDQ